MDKIAIYAGSFDPITLGHLDLIKRATRLFDKVIVAIGNNPKKKYMFDGNERCNMVRDVLVDTFSQDDLDEHVTWTFFSGLLAEYAERASAVTLIRGIRTGSDLDDELSIVFANRKISRKVDTIFMTPQEKYSFISSSVAKELCISGVDEDVLCKFVPKCVANYMYMSTE